jgi:hypothetical protein
VSRQVHFRLSKEGLVSCIPEMETKKERRPVWAPILPEESEKASRSGCFEIPERFVRPGFSCHSAACPTALLFCDALSESRIGRTTNSASPTTAKFMTEAAKNTECQLPV